MNREPIYAALFALAQTAASFKTTGRKLKAATDIPKESQPALFQIQHNETAQKLDGAPNRWLLSVSLVIYVNTGGDSEVAPTTQLNPIIGEITTLFSPNPATGRQTLGGLVRHAEIVGTIEIDEALMNGQAVAIVPLEILTERDWEVAP